MAPHLSNLSNSLYFKKLKWHCHLLSFQSLIIHRFIPLHYTSSLGLTHSLIHSFFCQSEPKPYLPHIGIYSRSPTGIYSIHNHAGPFPLGKGYDGSISFQPSSLVSLLHHLLQFMTCTPPMWYTHGSQACAVFCPVIVLVAAVCAQQLLSNSNLSGWISTPSISI